MVMAVEMLMLFIFAGSFYDVTPYSIDVCSQPSANLSHREGLDDLWTFNADNCSAKNTAMVVHFTQAGPICSDNAKKWLRIAGQNFCKLKPRSCLIIQKGWKVCSNIKLGFRQCISRLWIFNKTSLPKIKLRTAANKTYFEMTYYHVPCEGMKDSGQENLPTTNSQQTNVALIVLLAIFITVIVILVFRIWKVGAIKLLLGRRSDAANYIERKEQETNLHDGPYDPYAMASESVNIEPIYALAQDVASPDGERREDDQNLEGETGEL